MFFEHGSASARFGSTEETWVMLNLRFFVSISRYCFVCYPTWTETANQHHPTPQCPRNDKLPEIVPLMDQLKKVYNFNNLVVTEELTYRQAWGIKGACGLIKRKARRQEFTKDYVLLAYCLLQCPFQFFVMQPCLNRSFLPNTIWKPRVPNEGLEKFSKALSTAKTSLTSCFRTDDFMNF